MENRSEDGTTQWLSELDDPRVRIIEQPELVSVDRNFSDAARAASGEYLRILCADDLLKPGAIAAHLAAFAQYPEAALVGSSRDIVDERGRRLIRGRGLDGLDLVNTRLDVVAACAEYGTNVVGEPFCRTAPVQMELPFSSELRFVLDIELYVRVLRHGLLATIPGSYSAFRVRPSGYSTEAASSQCAQFTQWMKELSSDPSLEITDEVIKRASAEARKNQVARNMMYRYLRVRERLRGFGRRRPS